MKKTPSARKRKTPPRASHERHEIRSAPNVTHETNPYYPYDEETAVRAEANDARERKRARRED